MKMIINKIITKHIWMDGMISWEEREKIREAERLKTFFWITIFLTVFILICVCYAIKEKKRYTKNNVAKNNQETESNTEDLSISNRQIHTYTQNFDNESSEEK